MVSEFTALESQQNQIEKFIIDDKFEFSITMKSETFGETDENLTVVSKSSGDKSYLRLNVLILNPIYALSIETSDRNNRVFKWFSQWCNYSVKTTTLRV